MLEPSFLCRQGTAQRVGLVCLRSGPAEWGLKWVMSGLLMGRSRKGLRRVDSTMVLERGIADCGGSRYSLRSLLSYYGIPLQDDPFSHNYSMVLSVAGILLLCFL